MAGLAGGFRPNPLGCVAGAPDGLGGFRIAVLYRHCLRNQSVEQTGAVQRAHEFSAIAGSVVDAGSY